MAKTDPTPSLRISFVAGLIGAAVALVILFLAYMPE